MKHFRRFLSMCMAVVILCGAAAVVSADHPFPTEKYPDRSIPTYPPIPVYGTIETGIYGTKDLPLPYPITRNMFDDINVSNSSYRKWYEEYYLTISESSRMTALAKMWFDSYRITSPEKWCEEYLTNFEKTLSNHETIMSPLDGEKQKYRVSDYTWDGRALTVQCEGDYNITYTTEKVYNYDIDQYVETRVPVGKFRVRAAIALTSKTDGGLEYLVEHSSFIMMPQTSYSGTATKTLNAVLPEIYDPLKHNVTLYFYGTDNYDLYSEEVIYSKFYNSYDITAPVPEVPGDVDGDGDVDAVDIATFSRYLSGGDVEITDTADITCDGKIITNDLAALRRLISGGEV